MCLNTCKTCKYWGNIPDKRKDGMRFCKFDNDTITCEKEKTNIDVEIFVHDDSGLYFDFVTAENYGCIHHEPKTKTN